MMNRLVPHLDAFVKTGAVPGLIAAVIRPDGVEVHQTGTMPDGVSLPQRTTTFRVASISKIFTVVALADLVREGKIRLEDTVESHLPDGVTLSRPGGEAITVAHLATHTAGWTDQQWDDQTRKAAVAGGWPWIYPRLAKIELTAKPGDRFSYSNVGMAILGHLVERASGQPYEDVIRARILDPLGMRHTRVTPLPGEPEPLFHAPTGPFAAAGGFHSTLDDLILFARVLLRVPHRPTSDPLSRPAGEGGVVVRGATPVARVLTPFQSLNAALSFTFLRRGHDTTDRPLYLGWHEDKAERLMHSGLWHAYLGLDRKKSFALVMLLTGQTSVNDALGSAAMACVAGEEASFPARPRT